MQNETFRKQLRKIVLKQENNRCLLAKIAKLREAHALELESQKKVDSEISMLESQVTALNLETLLPLCKNFEPQNGGNLDKIEEFVA